MEKSGGSRLLQIQAKFQQKQLQERELKIASLYEAQQARALDRLRHSPSSNSGKTTTPPAEPHPPPHVHPGKVRQMFEERRTKAGIDKSYPLQPINNNKQAARKPLVNGHTKPGALPNGIKHNSNPKTSESTTTTNGLNRNSFTKIKESTPRNNMAKHSSHTKVNEPSPGNNDIKHGSNSRISESIPGKTGVHRLNTKGSEKPSRNTTKNHVEKYNDLTNGNGTEDVNHNHAIDNNANDAHHKVYKTQSGPRVDRDEDQLDNGYMLEDETFPEAMAPMPTPRSPELHNEPKRPPRRTSGSKNEPVKTKVSPRSPVRKPSSESLTKKRPSSPVVKKTASVKPVGSKPSATGEKYKRTVNHSPTPSAPPSTQASNCVPCSVCGRCFAPDRLKKHEEICRKAHSKKRQPFDVLKHRLMGTEAEQFMPTIRRITQSNNTSLQKKPLNSNWRKKHEEFIQAIRAAKVVQAHLAAGGKLSDLPPPPPSENPDYVQCPHCGRRFNSSAAERHIPKCASYQFNKPKPTARKR